MAATCDTLVIKNAAGEDVTSKLNIKYVDGEIIINKRTVTLTSATDTKVYDGTALTNDEVTVGGDGFATGEGATYNVTGTQTVVGSSENTFTYTLNEGTKADNYEINQVEGTLTVTELTDKVTVTITENSGSEKYDGTEKTVTGYTVSIDNKLYTENDFTFSGNATVKGTDAGSYPMELKAEDFTNTSKNFSNVEFVIVDGTLEISKRTVTLTSADDEKVYDGTALTNDEVTVGGDGFATGEGATYNVTGTQTVVGSSENTFTYTLNEGTKADNYEINQVEGTLTVTELTDKVTVTITENSGSEKYDGTEKTVTGYTVSIDNKLYTENDFTFSGNATVKGTDAGSYPMELKAEDFTNTSKNFSNVEFVIVDGTLEISKRTVTLTSADDEKVYDGTALTNDEVTVGGDGFATGEGATYSFTGSQTLVGSSPNAFGYTLKDNTKAENYEITKTEGTLTVTGNQIDKPVKEEDVQSGEYKADEYQLGDKIPFTITVHNITVEPIENIIVIDETAEIVTYEGCGYTVSEDKHTATIALLESDATVIVKALHTVTSDDILKGDYENKVTVKTPGDKNFEADKTVDKIDEVNTALKVVKASNVAENTTVALGQEVTYTITVTNEGNVPFYNVTVDEDLKGLKITEVTGNSYEYTIDNELRRVILEQLPVGETVTITATYVATSDDILAGKITNHATATADPVKDPENPPTDTDKEEDWTDDVDSTLTVVKSTIDQQDKYELGETIEYKITVTNNGNVPFYNVVVEDLLEGAVITEDAAYVLKDGKAVIADLLVGETVVVYAEYTVVEKDILAGEVLNEVTAKADPIDDPKKPEDKIPEDDDDEKNETGDLNTTLSVIKETTNAGTGENGMYKLGEVITYDITVKNEGNVPFLNVIVTDTLVDAKIVAGEGYEINELGQATIDELPVGESVVVKAEYTVTSNDILKGYVNNNVTAEADPIEDPKKPGEDPKKPGDEDDEENKTDDVIDTLTVIKETTNAGAGENGMFLLGETITYDITVKNDGNVPYYNVVVTDELENAEIVAGEGYEINENGQAVIAVLAVGESVVVKAQYTVTSDDILAGKVINDATAEADEINDPKNPDEPKKPEGEDDAEDETDDIIDKLTVTKETTNAGTGENGTFKLGETIEYIITVKNDGNVPYYNVVVTDDLEGAALVEGEGYVLNENGQAEIEVLGVGEAVSVNAEYTVTSDDILNGKVTNVATAKADPIDDPKNPDEPKKPEGDDDKEDKTDDVDASMSLVKVTTSNAAHEDGDYRLGEVITYDITVTNNGNVPYYNVVVTDELIDATILAGEGYAINAEGKAVIDVLAVGASVTVKAEYEVVADDILAGTVVNNATAVGDPIDDPKNPDEPKVPTDEDDEENPTHTHYDYKVEHYLETEVIGVFEETPYETDEYKDVKFMDPATYESNDYEAMGFHYEAELDDVPSATVPANNELVIKLYYLRRTDLNYTIEFWYEESIGEEEKTYVKKADHPDVVVENVRYSTVIDEATAEVAKAAKDNVIYDYELEKIVGTTIDVENNIVSIYYDRQTTSYTVEYYYDGYLYERLTETFEGLYCGDVINGAAEKDRAGFLLEKVTPNALGHTGAYEGASGAHAQLTLCEEEDKNVIRLYYRQLWTTYRVYYYYDGVRDDSRTYVSAARPQATVISEYPDQMLPGYKLDKVVGIPMTLVEDQFENAIHVYYVSDEPTEMVTGSGIGMGLNVGECCE